MFKHLYSSPTIDRFVSCAIDFAFDPLHASEHKTARNYDLYTVGDTPIRPIRSELYDLGRLRSIDLMRIIRSETPTPNDRRDFLKAVYTIQRGLEATMDVKCHTQVGRKVSGHIFEGLVESLVKARFDVVLKNGRVPIETPDGTTYLSFDKVFESGTTPVITSIKTSTKDRACMMFSDKYIHKSMIGDCSKFVSVILNDIQRTPKGIASTFLPGHHSMYSAAFGPMDGHYYVDRPVNTQFKTLDAFLFDDLALWLNV